MDFQDLDQTQKQIFLEIASDLEKVMPGDSPQSVAFSERPRMSDIATDLLQDLNAALYFRRLYENDKTLALEDFWHVGGKLNALIRNTNSSLSNLSNSFPDGTSVEIRERLKEVISFRQFVLAKLLQANNELQGGN